MIPDARSLKKFAYTKENSGELSNVCKTLANNIGERRFYTWDGQRFLPRSIRKKFCLWQAGTFRNSGLPDPVSR